MSVIDESGMTGYGEVPSKAQEERASAASAGSLADLVPTNWLDPLLTGKDRVIGEPPYNCQDIENLLRAIKERIAIAEGK
jgi:hypothetical protein